MIVHVGLADWASEIDMRKLTLSEIQQAARKLADFVVPLDGNLVVQIPGISDLLFSVGRAPQVHPPVSGTGALDTPEATRYNTSASRGE